MVARVAKTERVQAALRGEALDHAPVSAWWHDYEREWSAEKLAEATLEAYRTYDWDFIKVNPRACYYAEDWGARFEYRPGRQPEMLEPAVRSAGDLARIGPLDVSRGAYGEQVQALRLIGQGLGGEAPFLQTVFCPLAVLSRSTGSTKLVQRLMREHADAVHPALEAITETLIAYSRACLDAGAAGIFYATVEWGSRDVISPEDYDRFCRPYDLRVLETVQPAAFNVLHVCRDNNHLLRLLDYPAAAFHWDARGAGNPTFTDIASRSPRAVMGGVSVAAMLGGATADVHGEAAKALAETKGARFFLAPGCSLDPETPPENLRALVAAAAR
jgi:uroporphyrinogen decarboxylase